MDANFNIFNIWVLQILRYNHPPMMEFPLPLKPEQVVCRTCWYFGDPLTTGDPWTSPSRSRATMIFEVNILAGFTLIHIMLGYGGYEHHQRKNGDIAWKSQTPPIFSILTRVLFLPVAAVYQLHVLWNLAWTCQTHRKPPFQRVDLQIQGGTPQL